MLQNHDDEFRSRNARGILLDAAMCLNEFIITAVNIAHRVDRSEFAFGKRQPSAFFTVASQYLYLLSPWSQESRKSGGLFVSQSVGARHISVVKISDTVSLPV